MGNENGNKEKILSISPNEETAAATAHWPRTYAACDKNNCF